MEVKKQEGDFNWGGADLLYSGITRVDAQLAQLHASIANSTGSPRYRENMVGETLYTRGDQGERIEAFGFGS